MPVLDGRACANRQRRVRRSGLRCCRSRRRSRSGPRSIDRRKRTAGGLDADMHRRHMVQRLERSSPSCRGGASCPSSNRNSASTAAKPPRMTGKRSADPERSAERSAEDRPGESILAERARRAARPMSPTFQPAIASGHSSIAASWHRVRLGEVRRQAPRESCRAAVAGPDARRRTVARSPSGNVVPVVRQSDQAPYPFIVPRTRRLKGMGNRCHYQYTAPNRHVLFETRGAIDVAEEWPWRTSMRLGWPARFTFSARWHWRSVSSGRAGARSACSRFREPSAGRRHTAGGRDGRIIPVTTLAGDGRGSLRAALEATEPRIIVFEVGGVIDSSVRTLRIKSPNVTIAGQTAPSPGITLIRGGIDMRDPRRDPATHPRTPRRGRAKPRAAAGARTRSPRRPAPTT